jgi:hypothetical protein
LRSPLVSFVPQMVLTIGSGLLFGRRKQDLVLAWFVQTVVFVMFNKVCTSQVGELQYVFDDPVGIDSAFLVLPVVPSLATTFNPTAQHVGSKEFTVHYRVGWCSSPLASRGIQTGVSGQSSVFRSLVARSYLCSGKLLGVVCYVGFVHRVL